MKFFNSSYQKVNSFLIQNFKILSKRLYSFDLKIFIFILFLYFSLSNFFLIEIVLFLCHKEYYLIENEIIKKIFFEQFSNSTSLTLISSPIQTYLILLLPVITFFYNNIEIFSVFFVTFLLIIYRFYCFIQIYMLNNIKDFYPNKIFIENKNENNNLKENINTKNFMNSNNLFSNEQKKKKIINNNNIIKIKNPLPKNLNTFIKIHSKIEKIILNNNNSLNFYNYIKKENENKSTSNNENEINESLNSYDSKYNNKETNLQTLNNNIEFNNLKKNTITSLKNSYNKKYITEKMFYSCLIVISLDFIFIIFYALPLSYEISLIKTKIGFKLILLILLIFFCWKYDEITFNENKMKNKNYIYNDHQILNPFNYTNLLNFYYSFILSFIISIIFKIYMKHFSNNQFFNLKEYILIIFSIIIGCNLGIFFEFFLRKCGNIEENFLNNSFNKLINFLKINSLCYPICYYFLYNYVDN